MYRFIFILLPFFGASILYGQGITVINNFEGVDRDTPIDQMVLRRVSEQTIILNEYEPTNTGVRSQLEQMINYGLRSYIDSQYHLFDGRAQALANQAEFASASTAIVKNAIWIHELDFIDAFKGFSKETTALVNQLRAADGKLFRMGGEEMMPATADGVGLYYFQRAVLELKQACEREIDEFLDQQMPQKSATPDGLDTDYTILPLTDYDLPEPTTNQMLLADLQIDESLLSLNGKGTKKKKGRRAEQQEFNERILALLESNNKIMASYGNRFENLQFQIDAIRGGTSQPDAILREIADLRQLIKEVSEGREVTESDGSRTRLAPNEGLTLRYEKNAHQLNANQKQVLAEAKNLLQTNPGYTALITGYADKSGNPELNEWISRQRAIAVRNYLTQVGIDQNRLIINFLGDSKSQAIGPEDRKVEIKYLLNYTALR